MTALYKQHLTHMQKYYRAAMNKFHLDTIIISSGYPTYFFQDDRPHPFKAYSGAQQWLPFTLPAGIHIIIHKRGLPTLFWPEENDFWHAKSTMPTGNWQDFWNIVDNATTMNIYAALTGQYAWLGPKSTQTRLCEKALSGEVHDKLCATLDYQRAYKTEFEIRAIAAANKKAVMGHRAAEQAFFDGKSEFAIYQEYLIASGQTSAQEPYAGIVALNENAATLHYENKQISSPTHSNCLLIDAGAAYHGYASDITRTITEDQGLFGDLLQSMETLQVGLCEQAIEGVDFQQLHDSALHGVASILLQYKICSLGVEEQLQKGIPQIFFPHGLGHLLGLQVHDVGGHQIDEEGNKQSPANTSPFLRLTRTLKENMVLTIEPGLYFIPTLLAKMQADIPQHGCDLDKIESLLPFGGIRIEDNIVVGKQASRNLTREAFLA